MSKEIIIYTDGGCRNNGDKKGGWGALILSGKKKIELNGGEDSTTSNKMELTAAIKAINYAIKKCKISDETKIILHSDSQYLINGMNIWTVGWIKNKWKSSTGSSVLNQDLWKQLLDLEKKLNITWVWVKGHAGHEF